MCFHEQNCICYSICYLFYHYMVFSSNTIANVSTAKIAISISTLHTSSMSYNIAYASSHTWLSALSLDAWMMNVIPAISKKETWSVNVVSNSVLWCTQIISFFPVEIYAHLKYHKLLVMVHNHRHWHTAFSYFPGCYFKGVGSILVTQ